MNPRLQQILRHVERNRAKPPPAEKVPSGDLAGVIEEMIARQVQERVSAELDRHRERLQPTGPRLQALLRDRPAPSSELPPPAPRTAPPVDMTMLIHRNAEGRAVWLEVGNLKFDVQRNALGRVTGMRQRTESPVLPPLEIPFKASAREYHEGEPR